MLASAASAPTVCTGMCQLFHLAYDGTSFLQVVLCDQLHSSLPARKMLFVPCRTCTMAGRRTRGDRHLQSVCHLFCWHLRPHSIEGETAICCRQRWTGRGREGIVRHAALFCWSEVMCRYGASVLLKHFDITQVFKMIQLLQRHLQKSHKCDCKVIAMILNGSLS